MRTNELGRSTVPTGRVGPWEVSEFEVTEKEARRFNLQCLFGGSPLEQILPGRYRRLTHDERGVVMSNTRMEIITNLAAYNAAKGRVLVFGLGMGMLLEAILARPEVEYVRVVELDPDVIRLVGPHFAGAGARCEIVQGDALTYRGEPDDPKWNLVWADIWDAITSANLPDMATLGRRWNRRRADLYLAWGRDWIRADRRR